MSNIRRLQKVGLLLVLLHLAASGPQGALAQWTGRYGPNHFDYCDEDVVDLGRFEESNGHRAVQVVYTVDASAFSFLIRSMISLTRHLKPPRRCVIHLVVPEQDLAGAASLVECFRRSTSGLLVRPTVRVHRWLGPPSLRVNNNTFQPELSGMPVVYARWYLHLFVNASRVLYLDPDTIINEDVTVLYGAHMTHVIAAAKALDATFGGWYFLQAPALMRSGRDPHSHYFNTGVQLIELDRWKVHHIASDLEALQLSYPQADEQFLENLRFPEGSYQVLDCRWNFDPRALWLCPTIFTRIVHYFGGENKDFSDKMHPRAHELFQANEPHASCGLEGL